MHISRGLRVSVFVFIILSFFHSVSRSQEIADVHLSSVNGLQADSLLLTDSTIVALSYNRPLYSFLLNNNKRKSTETTALKTGKEYTQIYDDILQTTFIVSDSTGVSWKGDLKFRNIGKDTITISNLVPFGEDSSSVQITGKGPADLARVWLFRPGYKPVRVILPDNAWEMGYSSFRCGNHYSVCSVT
ncbi:MAG: hypothetical protein HZB98_16080, partial [Bacteroidia bacterium]|nr:hypothetical protein [Bacteroidia bacterium]